MKHEEDDLQIATADLLRTLARPGVIFWHTPNGGNRSKREAGRFKAMGVRAGVADWTIIWTDGPLGIPIVLFIELKSKTGVSSSAQKAFAADSRSAGCAYEIVRTLDEFLNVLDVHGVPIMKARVAA